jgi:hypothetical protein
VNGLAKKNELKYDVVDRDEYIEFSNPLCIRYKIFNLLFTKYMKNKIYTEFIDVLNLFNIKYELVEGHYKYLRKITTIEDVTP